MEVIPVSSWNELVDQVDRLRAELAELSAVRKGHASELLFRGQSDSRWGMETTLERHSPQSITFAEYFRLVANAKPQIEALLNHRWDLPDYPELEKWAEKYDNPKLSPFPGYDYLVYLRHHGFPSPLLDWTRSLPIAAYFAFADGSCESSAIYVFSEYRGWGKAGLSNAPQILSLGPNVRAHPRHFAQQSSYTVSCQFDGGPWRFAPHTHASDTSHNDQDRLWKLVLPSSERRKVLRYLDEHNINAYSLFQSEEGLLKTIATRALILRN